MANKSPNPSGLCLCGCGEKTRIATGTDKTHGYVRGEPVFYVSGHQRRGRKHSPETRKKMSVWGGKRGAETPAWKGSSAKYSAVHMWIGRNFTKTGVCEECGVVGRTEWSNVDADYGNRERSNWRELCRSCHVIDDHARPRRPVR